MDTATLSVASGSVVTPDSATSANSSASYSLSVASSATTSKLSNNNVNGFYNDLLLAPHESRQSLQSGQRSQQQQQQQREHQQSNGYHPEIEKDQDQDQDTFAPAPIMAHPRKTGLQLISEGTQTTPSVSPFPQLLQQQQYHHQNHQQNINNSNGSFINSPPTWPSGTIARFHTASSLSSSSPEQQQQQPSFQEQQALSSSSPSLSRPLTGTSQTATATASFAASYSTTAVVAASSVVASITAQPIITSSHTPMTPPRISSLSPKSHASQLQQQQSNQSYLDGPASPPPSPPQPAVSAAAAAGASATTPGSTTPGSSPTQGFPARFSSLMPNGANTDEYFSSQQQHQQLYMSEALPLPQAQQTFAFAQGQVQGHGQGQTPLGYTNSHLNQKQQPVMTFALEPSPTLSATETSTDNTASSTKTTSYSSPASSILSTAPIIPGTSGTGGPQPTPVDYALAALSAGSPRPSTSTTSSMMSSGGGGGANRPRPSSYAPTKITDVSSTLATMTTLAALPIPPQSSSSSSSATVTANALSSQGYAQDFTSSGFQSQVLQQHQQPQQQQQQQQQQPFYSSSDNASLPQQQQPRLSPRSHASVLISSSSLSGGADNSFGTGASGAGGGYQLSRQQSPTTFAPPTRASTLDIRKIQHTGSLLLGDSPTSSYTSRHQQQLQQQQQQALQDSQGESSSRVRRKQIYRRNTYSADLASTSFQRSDDEMEMDELEEARRRMDALKKSSSRRMSKRKKDDDTDRVLIGTRIGEDHANYVLMYNMLTGIRVSVSRCQAKPQRALVDEDFTSAHKLAFDITGNELTPSSKYDFKFKDYAPWVFRHLREDFHIDASDYLVSLTSKYILSELGSPGKSGSFFYFSQDYRFIIKTIHHAEHKFMRKILKDYFNHVKQNPHTLLCRFFGLHRVKLPHGRKIHFVVMGNVFPPNRDIHETYDLKGSTLGRAISDEELNNNPRATQKDLNWVNRNRKLELGPEKRHLFVEQTKRDVELLARLNIMDYSLLIGIHDIERGNRDNIRDNTLKVFHPDTSKQLTREPSRRDKRESKVNALRMAVKVSDPQALGPSTLPSDSFSERRHCIFYADDGGLLSTNEQNERGEDLYYLGIIDILTPYNYVKKVEHYWKSLSQDKHAISSVNPREYASRFLSFMIHALRVNYDVLGILDKQAHPHSE